MVVFGVIPSDILRSTQRNSVTFEIYSEENAGKLSFVFRIDGNRMRFSKLSTKKARSNCTPKSVWRANWNAIFRVIVRLTTWFEYRFDNYLKTGRKSAARLCSGETERPIAVFYKTGIFWTETQHDVVRTISNAYVRVENVHSIQV